MQENPQRPLNFLHLTTFYPPYSFGGDATFIYRLSRALAENGHHVDVVHCVDSYNLLHRGEPPVKFAEHPGVVRHELRSGFGWLSPFLAQQTGRPWLKWKMIRGLLNSRPYDVIHFHNISLLGPAILSAAPLHGQAVKIYTTHEYWLVCPTHMLCKFDRALCDRPECLRCILHAGRPPQLWRYTGLIRRMAAHVDQFVAPTRFAGRMHAERGFPQPVAHLPLFVDRVDSDWQQPEPRPHDRSYFLFVGRLEAVKGLQTLIALWDRVPECDLVVAGTGTYETELRAAAAGNPRIRFMGPLPQRTLGALYFHALACIVPTIGCETFGLICAEAFSRKTPVIVRGIGPLPEIIEDSGGGFVFRSDEELLDAMRRIVGSPGLRSELGQKGYDAFVRLWSRDAHFRLYFEFLNRAAEKKFGSIPWA